MAAGLLRQWQFKAGDKTAAIAGEELQGAAHGFQVFAGEQEPVARAGFSSGPAVRRGATPPCQSSEYVVGQARTAVLDANNGASRRFLDGKVDGAALG